ncbi:MAG: glycerol-3-phosphate dehydrogenase, partial [Baekduia sp.]|nr:glycerol-3-phosphate dehydrogenase [Baekduia sp.]
RELEHYRARVAAERESQEQDDDLGADAARLGAPDIAPTLPVERLTSRNTRAAVSRDGKTAGDQEHAGEPVAPRK